MNDERTWQERLQAMYDDEAFMAWLREYDPSWQSAYSGDLLGMYDAYLAGRQSLEEEEEG